MQKLEMQMKSFIQLELRLHRILLKDKVVRVVDLWHESMLFLILRKKSFSNSGMSMQEMS